jgi:hypothetical protein
MKHKHTPEEIASAKKNAKLTMLILALVIIACTADNWFNF